MPGMVLDAALALVPGIPYPDNGPKPIPTGGTVQTPRQTAYAARGAHSGAGDGPDTVLPGVWFSGRTGVGRRYGATELHFPALS